MPPLPDHRTRRPGPQFASSDDRLEAVCGTIAYINGKPVAGFYNEARVKIRLGQRAGHESCITTFCFKQCCCPTALCGDVVLVMSTRMKIGKGGLSKPDEDGYVCAYLTDCPDCQIAIEGLQQPHSGIELSGV